MVAPLTLVVATLVGAFLIRLGPRLGMIDRPDGTELKPHQGEVVPLGGFAVFVAVHLGMVMSSSFDPGLFAASLLALVLGAVDDRLGLPRMLRLVVEIGIGAVLVFASAAPGFEGGTAVTVVAIVLVVVTVNAVNLFDGLDGLVGSVATVSALGLAVLADVHGLDLGFGIILAAALLGFLVWNWPQARLFLGDNGSYSVAVFLVYGIADAADPDSTWSLLAVAGVLGVFVVDLAATLVRRRALGFPTFGGDRNHLYDQLHRRGLPVWGVTLAMAGGQVVLVGTVVVCDALLGDITTVIVLAVVLVAIVAALGSLGFLGRQENLGSSTGRDPNG